MEILSKVWRGTKRLRDNLSAREEIQYVTEGSNWVIQEIGQRLQNHLGKDRVGMTVMPVGFRNKVIHYGSAATFFEKRPIF